MKYVSFDLTDEKGINTFLPTLETSPLSAKSSIKMLDGKMHITYDERTLEQIEKDMLVGGVDLFIAEKRTELLVADEDERYARSLALRGQKTDQNAIDAANRGYNIAAVIRAAEEIRAEVVAGAWSGMSKNLKGTVKRGKK